MTKAIDKEKLLEWLEALYEPTMGNEEWNTVISKIQEEIESGTFDLPDVDEIGELDNANRLMHERNDRLEKELRDAKAKITVLERDNEMLETEVARLSHIDDEAEINREEWRKELTDLRAKLNTALEALEWIRDAGTDYQSINKARQAIQAIKGAEE